MEYREDLCEMHTGSGYGYGDYPPILYAQPSPTISAIVAQPLRSASCYGSSDEFFPLRIPPELKSLARVDKLIVKQEVELLEALCGCDAEKTYKISDFRGNDLYAASFDVDCCASICPFDMYIRDASGRKLIHVNRTASCCLQQIQVFSPPGKLVGSVEQELCCSPCFVVKDEEDNVVLRIEGPCCAASFCSVDFEISTEDGGTQVGQITKEWSGWLRETFTEADTFAVSFPMDLDVRLKAVVLGACFLIDMMYYERS